MAKGNMIKNFTIKNKQTRMTTGNICTAIHTGEFVINHKI